MGLNDKQQQVNNSNQQETRNQVKESVITLNVIILIAGILAFWFLGNPNSNFFRIAGFGNPNSNFFRIAGWGLIVFLHILGGGVLGALANYKGRSNAWGLLILLSLFGYLVGVILLIFGPNNNYKSKGAETPVQAKQEPSFNPVQVAAATPKFCSSCGGALTVGASFCQNCGAAIAQAQIPLQPTLPEQPERIKQVWWKSQIIPMVILVVALIGGSINLFHPFGLSLSFSGFHKAGKTVSTIQASEYNRQGIALFNQGKNDEAITEFSKAIQVYTSYPSAYTNRGIVYIVKEQYTLAITDFNSAININPNYALAYGNRGLAYIYTGDYKEAVADLNKSLQVDPEDDKAWNNRGVALEQMGDIAGAIDSYATAFKLDPSNENANNNRQVLQSGSRSPGINVNAWGSFYRPSYEEAWVSTSESEYTSSEQPTDLGQPVGGAGIQIKTLTGEWINDSPRYGLVTSASDGPTKWNYDVVLKLVETNPNTGGGLRVEQPNTFTGSMQRTLRSITGPGATVPECTSEIGRTRTVPISGTRSGRTVYLATDITLTFDGDHLYGKNTQKGVPTWSSDFFLKRK